MTQHVNARIEALYDKVCQLFDAECRRDDHGEYVVTQAVARAIADGYNQVWIWSKPSRIMTLDEVEAAEIGCASQILAD
jgi:hypothetical protein